jgi:flagellar motor switch protein FliG
MDISMEFGELFASLENEVVKKIIKIVDKKTLAKSLKTINPKIAEKIFGGMTKDGAEELKKNVSALGTVRLEEVETAQREIIRIVTQELSK